MELAFCVETLENALARHGKPDIFNTDQGSQFTGAAFSGALTDNGIAISMECRQDFTKHRRSGCFSGVLRPMISAAQSWREGSGNV